MNNFVHLHLHTQYSILHSSIRIDKLMDRVKELNMNAVSMTDTNNIFGAIDFYCASLKNNIHPIIGCEINYKIHDLKYSISTKGLKSSLCNHMVLLCENITGYNNLCKILTNAYKNIEPSKRGSPQGGLFSFNKEDIYNFREGLIVLSGALKGEIPFLLKNGETEKAADLAKWFKKTFFDSFYIELVDSFIPEQIKTNELLYELANDLNIPTIVSSNCHYLNKEDSDPHEVLQCIENGRNLDIDRPSSLVPNDFYLKPPSVIRENMFKYIDACDRTLEIKERCKLNFKMKDSNNRQIYHLPEFKPSHVKDHDDFNIESYFKLKAKDGLKKRFKEHSFLLKRKEKTWEETKKTYYKRLDYEIQMILKTGFVGYFLIVADFITWAKSKSIPVGPGRGSGAGSLVSYALEITDLDPIRFNLLFERFLNLERISMPDFDVDFCQEKRNEVIEYVSNKYGHENVCQIITFGKLQARAVIKDVGRVLGMNFSETDKLTKLLPDELNLQLSKAIKRETLLAKIMEEKKSIKTLMDYALFLEGLYRNTGVHAAGVIITDVPIVNYCPVYVGTEGDLVTQFDKDFAEKIGLIKFDFLGLKTLTVINNTVKYIKENYKDDSIDSKLFGSFYDDKKVYELISKGDTRGVFQLESSGMKNLCMRLRPSSIEDLIAINALYRPGPLGSGMVDEFIECKHGRKEIKYDVPELEPILRETYGVILYQEQVMRIARVLAGYSLGQADMLRKAMGKKIISEMNRHRDIFINGAIKKISKIHAKKVFDLIAKFAEYGFNKSHSAAYAVRSDDLLVH